MSELVLRLAVYRLQNLVLAEETATLNRSARGHLYSILGEVKRMQVLLKGKTQHKDEEVRKIEELDYQIEDVIETYRVLGRSRRNLSCFNGIKMVCMRYTRIPLTLQRIRSEIESIIVEVEGAVPVVADKLKYQCQTRSSTVLLTDQYGLDKDIEQVRQALLSGIGSDILESSSNIPVPVIPIYGYVGSGKTTLAKKICEDSSVAREFKSQIWIDVPDKFGTRDILRQILEQILDSGHEYMLYSSEEQMLLRIEKELKSQRSLIVIDDIRSIEAWETVCKTLPKLDRGSHVLVTTRVGYVAEYISRNQFVHTMKPLNEEVLHEKVLPPRDKVYNELPDHLKPCFVYLGHFVEDQEIDPEKLSHLWMIEGLLSTGESARGESTMEMTERYLRELALKGIVKVQAEEVPTTKKFKACSVVQGIENLCVSNCEQKRFLKIIDLREKDYSLSSIDEPRRLVIYLGKHRVDIEPKFVKIIRSLRVVLGSMQQIRNELIWWPNEMLNLEEFRVLRILDFDGIDFRGQKIPTGIFNLELLRYLSFKGCALEELPSSISKLYYLQVLDLRVKELIEIKIPNVLGNMRRLNHLYLPLKFVTQNGKKLGLSSLTELETLENFNTTLCRADDIIKLLKLRYLGAKVEGSFEDFVSVTNYMKSTPSRNCLHSIVDVIDFDCYAEERHSVLRELFQCQVARTLHFKGHIGRLPSSDKISPSFTQLVLNNSHLNESSMPTLEKLPNLGVLVLSDDAYIAKKIIFSDSGFPKLKRLELLNLCFLEKLEVANTAMPILSSLKIKNCDKLESLPDCLEIRASNHFLSIIWPEKGRD